LGVCRYGQALPLHPGVEHSEDEVKDAIIAQFALGTPLGHREVRQEKCSELGFRELDGNRRRCRLCYRYAHHARTSCAGYCNVLENQIPSNPTRGWEHLQNSQPLIWTNPPWGCLLAMSRRCSTLSGPSMPREPPFFWWSKTLTWPSPLPTVAMSCRWA